MKKAATLWIVLCLIGLLFAGCGAPAVQMGGSTEPQADPGTTAATGTATLPTGATTKPTETPTEPVPTEPEAMIDPMVIFEEGGISITVTDLTAATGFGSYSGKDARLQLHVVNGTDRNIFLMATVNGVNINGISLEGALNHVVIPAGEEGDTFIFMEKGMLKEVGIDTIATIRCAGITVNDADTWERLYVVEEFSVNTVYAEGHTQPIDDTGAVIYDKNGITVIYRGTTQDSGGLEAKLLVKNSTQMDISVSTEGIALDGTVIDPDGINFGMFRTIYAQSVSYGEIEVDFPIPEELLEGGTVGEPGAISQVSFRLWIGNASSYEMIDRTDVLTVSTVAE